jgi:hypothetical protein
MSHIVRKQFILVFICGFGVSLKAAAPAQHLITFFIEQGKDEPVELKKEADHIVKRITKPVADSDKLLEQKMTRQKVAGVYATYLGWSATSDPNGQVIFPRKHDENRVQVVVTRSLQPVMAEENLIHHFVAGFAEPVAFYDFQYKENKAKKTAEWHVKKSSIPPSRIIPLYAVVVVASPDQIHIPEGIFPAFKGGNLILPTIYARPNLNKDVNAIQFLRVNRYFAPVEIVRRYATTQYAEMVLS